MGFFEWKKWVEKFHLTVFEYIYIYICCWNIFEDKLWQKLGATVGGRSKFSPWHFSHQGHSRALAVQSGRWRVEKLFCRVERNWRDVSTYFVAACQIGSLLCTEFMRQTNSYILPSIKLNCSFRVSPRVKLHTFISWTLTSADEVQHRHCNSSAQTASVQGKKD